MKAWEQRANSLSDFHLVVAVHNEICGMEQEGRTGSRTSYEISESNRVAVGP